jgi:putative transposase
MDYRDDGGKKIKGRKRHLLVDTEGEGFVLKALPSTVPRSWTLRGDQDATLRKADERLPRLSQLWLEAGYRGEDKGADWALRRPWGGARISLSVRKSPPPRSY